MVRPRHLNCRIRTLRNVMLFSTGLKLGAILLFSAGGVWCVHAKEVLPEPSYENTFYLFMNDGYRGSPTGQTPYDEGWPHGPLPYAFQVAKLNDMIARVGPDGPYLRLGVGECLWPTETVNSSNGWEYQGLEGLGQTGPATVEDEQIPRGPDLYFNTTIIRSWAQVGVPGMLFLNSGNLVRQVWTSMEDTLAVPGNLTAFLEGFPEVVQRYDDDRISLGDNLDGIHEPRDYVEGGDWGNANLGTMLGFSRLNPDSVMGYWNRNMQAAMAHVLAINDLYPGLVVAVSIEPENDMNHVRCYQGDCAHYADFSPLAMEEWRQWLAHTGIYGPGGAFEGQGADPWYPSVFDFNAATGSSFSTWDEVDPRSPKAGPGVWDMYVDGGDGDGEWQSVNPEGSGHVQGWGEIMVQHRCEDSVNLLWDVAGPAGWSPTQIFTHQVPGGFVDDALNPEDVPYWGYGHRLCTLAACAVTNGRPGITGFRETTVNMRLFEALRELAQDGQWANLEFNPLKHSCCEEYSSDYDLWSAAYRMNWEMGAHLLCGFRWWVPPETPTWWANIRPDFHRPPEQGGDPAIEWESRLRATHDFVSDNAIRFRPWSPDASLTDDLDYLPPSPRLGRLHYEARVQMVSFEIDPAIYRGCERLLWYDTEAHDMWPGLQNTYGWPEFSNGRFVVHRDTVPAFEPSALNVLTTLMVPSFSVVDSVLPVAGSIFYAVVAVDNGGDMSDPARIWVAPQIIAPDSVHVTLQQHAALDTTVLLANTGLKPLYIDSVAAPSPWLSVSEFPLSIAPNDVAGLSIALESDDMGSGTYNGDLLVYSNDPFQPVTSIAVSMEIEALPADAAALPGALMITPQPASNRVMVKWRLGLPACPVTLELVDIAGRVVHTIGGFTHDSGVFEARLELDGAVPSGLYVARASAPGLTMHRRVVILR